MLNEITLMCSIIYLSRKMQITRVKFQVRLPFTCEGHMVVNFLNNYEITELTELKKNN